MFWIIFFGIAFIVSSLFFAWFIWQKWSHIRLLDVDSIPESVSKKKKQELLRQRIERTGKKVAQKAQKDFFRPLGKTSQYLFRTLAGRLTAAERRYQQEKNKAATQEGDMRVIDQLLDEAKQFIKDEVWDQAEKRLIQIISLDAHNRQAYEILGRVYLQMKDYALAKETFAFLHKIDKKDASVIASLGEVSQLLGEIDEAVLYFEKAAMLRPKNPKYLDLWIESIIERGDVHKATTILDKLAEVNPDNKKIPLLEKKINTLRKKKKEKSAQ